MDRIRCFVVTRHWLRQYPLESEIRQCLLERVQEIWRENARTNMADSQMLIQLQEMLNGGHQRAGSLASQASSVPTLRSYSPSLRHSTGGEKRSIKSLLRRWLTIDEASDLHPQASLSSLSNLSDLTGDSTPDPLVWLDARRRGRWLLSESSEAIAQALCLLEARWLTECDWQELLEYPRRISPAVQGQIDRFNGHIRQWVAEVTRSNDYKEQHAILLKWLRIAAKSLELGNLNSAMKLILALQNSAVQACQLAWQRLSQRDLRLYEALIEWASPVRNFGRLRQSLDDFESRQCPCIPLFGLFLSDLAMNEGRPSSSDLTIIPWYRWSMVAKIIQRYQRVQSLAAGYTFVVSADLLSALESKVS